MNNNKLSVWYDEVAAVPASRTLQTRYMRNKLPAVIFKNEKEKGKNKNKKFKEKAKEEKLKRPKKDPIHCLRVRSSGGCPSYLNAFTYPKF